MPTILISGTDTGIGKTWVSVRILEMLRKEGRRAVGYKPVAAGCENIAGEWVNEDAVALREASSIPLSYAEVNPVALPEPIAPHIAARHAGQSISTNSIIAGANRLQEKADWVLVEGAGGLCVPLNESDDFLSLAQRTAWPVLLVVGMRLGCINHAILSAKALDAAGLRWAWVANLMPPSQPALEENLQTLESALTGPRLDPESLEMLESFCGQSV